MVGLSSPAVTQRIYKMKESGIINGYFADINIGIFKIFQCGLPFNKNPKNAKFQGSDYSHYSAISIFNHHPALHVSFGQDLSLQSVLIENL
jgi:DNA-binding Lrp family transcriptional regulator